MTSNSNLSELQSKVAMVYDPGSGQKDVAHTEASQYRRYHADIAWLFNPWTGKLREATAVSSDVFGELIRPPNQFSSPLQDITWTRWVTEPNTANSVAVHTRVIGGILCRWWGTEPPKGRILLDAFVTDCIQKGFTQAIDPPEQLANQESV